MEKTIITVVETEVYKAWCYPQRGLIHHQWLKHCKGEPFRDAMSRGLEAFEQYGCSKWLSDDQLYSGPMDSDDWTWGVVNFTEPAIKAGWKHSAMVMSPATFAAISTTALVDFFQTRGVEAAFFADFNEAKTWIFSK